MKGVYSESQKAHYYAFCDKSEEYIVLEDGILRREGQNTWIFHHRKDPGFEKVARSLLQHFGSSIDLESPDISLLQYLI